MLSKWVNIPLEQLALNSIDFEVEKSIEKHGFLLIKQLEDKVSFSFRDADPENYLFLCYNKKGGYISIKADTKIYRDYRFLLSGYKVFCGDDIDSLFDRLLFNGRTISEHIDFFNKVGV
jgi:hypothetical protein